jgi:phospholipase/carboxylesterase
MPLMVALHGGGGDASGPIAFLGPYAEAHGFLLLAPESRGSTWDGIVGPFGPDVATIEVLLELTFDRCAVDLTRVAIEGFSDGAGEALGLGLANGDFFRWIIAFSPGIVAPSESPDVGLPRIFLSHGRQDPIIPFTTSDELIVPYLQQLGYNVTFVPYDGVHAVTPEVALEAVTWFKTGGQSAQRP